MHTSREILAQVRRALHVASAFSAAICILLLTLPLVALHAFEPGLPVSSSGFSALLVGLAVAALATVVVLEACRRIVVLRASLWLDHTLGQWLMATQLHRRSTRDLERETEAVATLRNAIAEGRLWPTFELPFAAAACALVYLVEPLLGIAAATVVTASLGCSFINLGGSTASDTIAASRSRAARWSRAVERAVRCDGAHAFPDAATRHWAAQNSANVGGAYAVGRRRAVLRPLIWGGIIAAGTVLLAFGAHLVATAQLTPGVLAAILMLLAVALTPLARLAANVDHRRKAQHAWTYLSSLDITVASAASAHRPSEPGRVTLENASFQFPGTAAAALTAITLDIEPGEIIGIIGPAGSGKSALAALIAHAGGAAAGGQVAVGYVSDTPLLLPGTVADNIAGFDPRLATAVAATAEKSGAHDLIQALPNGYDTDVGEDGRALPLRARRAVALSRALHRAPRLLVLDEPELSLDDAGLDRLLTLLERLHREGVTLAMATREPRLLQATHRVVVLAAGRIEAVLGSDQIRAVAASKQPRLKQVA